MSASAAGRGGTARFQSLAGRGLASLSPSSVPSMLRPYLPGLVTSSSIAASAARVYRLPSWVPSAGSPTAASPGSGSVATSIMGWPPQATPRSSAGDRTTMTSVPSTWLRSRIPGLSFTLALLSRPELQGLVRAAGYRQLRLAEPTVGHDRDLDLNLPVFFAHPEEVRCDRLAHPLPG